MIGKQIDRKWPDVQIDKKTDRWSNRWIDKYTDT